MKIDRRRFIVASLAFPALYLPMLRRSISPGQVEIPAGLGVGISWHQAEKDGTWYDRVLAALRPPWWYNWQFDQIARPGYIPMLWRPEPGPLFEASIEAAKRYPQKLWFLFSAPEREPGSEVDPKSAAQLSKEWTQRAHGFTCIGGVRPTPEGYGWLSDYVAAGGPIPLAWHFHRYGANTAEEWPKFLNQDFFAWHQGDGRRLPVLITETNAGTTQDVAEQAEVMSAIIQRAPSIYGGPLAAAAWYAAYDPFKWTPWVNLVGLDGKPTPLGRIYTQKVSPPGTSPLP